MLTKTMIGLGMILILTVVFGYLIFDFKIGEPEFEIKPAEEAPGAIVDADGGDGDKDLDVSDQRADAPDDVQDTVMPKPSSGGSGGGSAGGGSGATSVPAAGTSRAYLSYGKGENPAIHGYSTAEFKYCDEDGDTARPGEEDLFVYISNGDLEGCSGIGANNLCPVFAAGDKFINLATCISSSTDWDNGGSCYADPAFTKVDAVVPGRIAVAASPDIFVDTGDTLYWVDFDDGWMMGDAGANVGEGQRGYDAQHHSYVLDVDAGRNDVSVTVTGVYDQDGNDITADVAVFDDYLAVGVAGSDDPSEIVEGSLAKIGETLEFNLAGERFIFVNGILEGIA